MFAQKEKIESIKKVRDELLKKLERTNEELRQAEERMDELDKEVVASSAAVQKVCNGSKMRHQQKLEDLSISNILNSVESDIAEIGNSRKVVTLHWKEAWRRR